MWRVGEVVGLESISAVIYDMFHGWAFGFSFFYFCN